MTQIDFHFNVPDKLAYSCRLLRKAYATGAKIVLTGDTASLAELDRLLWSFSPTEFIPHCNAAADDLMDTTIASSPIVLAESPKNSIHSGVLINLGWGVPQEFERFERFIEIVTEVESDRQQGRQRWKYYADRGYALKRHNLAGAGEST